MAEVRREVDLADEPLPQQAGGDVGVQDLDRHPPVGVLLHGQEHPGHAAGADLPLHVIAVSEACTQGREHIEHERQVSHPRRRRRARGPRPPTGRFSRERYNFPMASAGLVQRSPYLRLVAYYLVLGLAVWLLIKIFPQIPQLLERFREVSVLGVASARRGRDLEQFTGAGAETLTQGELGVVTLLSMLAALLLVLPVAQVYMLTKQRSGYDQSVVQTVIILPMTVAATVILVQNSLALAFTLAAIVAAVRFRNTLKDTKDAVYIFLALAVGVAAGVFAPTVAAVMSVVFNAVVLTLWQFNVGNIYADRLGADRAARLEPHLAAAADDKKKKRFNGALVIHAARLEPAQRVAEALLDDQAKRWKLAEIVPSDRGTSTLEYLIRVKDDAVAAALVDDLKAQGAPDIVAAEFRSLRGLKPGKEE